MASLCVQIKKHGKAATVPEQRVCRFLIYYITMLPLVLHHLAYAAEQRAMQTLGAYSQAMTAAR